MSSLLHETEIAFIPTIALIRRNATPIRNINVTTVYIGKGTALRAATTRAALAGVGTAAAVTAAHGGTVAASARSATGLGTAA